MSDEDEYKNQCDHILLSRGNGERVPLRDIPAWCERKRDEAKDGETAYHYHQLAEMWRYRLGS